MNSDTSMPSPESVHISVLLNEAVDALAPKAGGRYLDGTVGMGGHSFAIMERTGGEGFLCGLDRDTQVPLSMEWRRVHSNSMSAVSAAQPKEDTSSFPSVLSGLQI